MKKLIDLKDAIDAIDRIFDRCEEIEAHLPEDDPDRTGYKMYSDYVTVRKYLHQLSSVQPEVIQCRYCKYYRPTRKECHRTYHRLSVVTPYWFCAGAEWRTDE